jgi:hypothetical protein
MAIDDAACSQRERTSFSRMDTEAMVRQEAPLLAPLMERNTQFRDNGCSVDSHIGNLTIDGDSRACGAPKQQPCDRDRDNANDKKDDGGFVNKDETASMAHDALMRAEYKTTVREMLDAASKSDHVQKGEGYYQVLQRMNPGMSSQELYGLSKEVRAVNGNNHLLHRGQQFELLSADEKNAVLGNIMNDYDRAHGVGGLKDASLNPIACGMARDIQARVEKAAEPELAKSFDPPSANPDGAGDGKPADKPTDESKPGDSPKPDEVPFCQQVRLAVEACHDTYQDVDRAARLAHSAAKLYCPESPEYKWAMKSLCDEMNNERQALDSFSKLVSQHPEDRKLTHELQKDLKAFTKQQVRIMKELHTILA